MRINSVKIVGGIATVIFIMIAGAKLFAWYKAKVIWDKVTAPAPIFVQANYGSISANLDGTIEYEDVEIVPVGSTSSIKANVVYFKAGSLMDFLFGDYDKNNLPRDFRIGMDNLQIPVTHDLAVQIYSWNLPGITGDSNPCQPNGVVDSLALKSMGYDAIDLNLRFSVYRSNETGLPIVELFAGNQFADFAEAKIFLKYSLNDLIGQTVVGDTDPFTSMSVEIDQTDFQKRLNRYCADSIGIDSSQYALYFTDELIELLSKSGIELGDETRSAIKAFHIGPSKVAFSIRPSSETSIRQLHHYKIKDALDLLGLQIYVNDKLIKPIDISLNDDQYALLSGKKQREDDQPQQEQASTKRARLTYKETKLADLAKYIGRDVIVVTSNKTIEGQLNQVLVKSISVNARKYGGVVTYPIRKKDILQVKVYR